MDVANGNAACFHYKLRRAEIFILIMTVALTHKLIIRFSSLCQNLTQGHLIDSSVCMMSLDPVMAYPKIVEPRSEAGHGWHAAQIAKEASKAPTHNMFIRDKSFLLPVCPSRFSPSFDQCAGGQGKGEGVMERWKDAWEERACGPIDLSIHTHLDRRSGKTFCSTYVDQFVGHLICPLPLPLSTEAARCESGRGRVRPPGIGRISEVLRRDKKSQASLFGGC